uniref:(northern house mosquito) hypothetical protein n=1 Tax=Culex pipiens TaxID=7175 RepID=A0A8D8A2B3_CULPI
MRSIQFAFGSCVYAALRIIVTDPDTLVRINQLTRSEVHLGLPNLQIEMVVQQSEANPGHDVPLRHVQIVQIQAAVVAVQRVVITTDTNIRRKQVIVVWFSPLQRAVVDLSSWQ